MLCYNSYTPLPFIVAYLHIDHFSVDDLYIFLKNVKDA